LFHAQKQNDRSSSLNKIISSAPKPNFENIVGSKSQALETLAENPANISALQILAACHMHLNEFEAAKKAYERLIELQPQNPEGYFNLSITLKKLNKYQEALCSLQKTIDLDGQHAKAHNSLGVILRKLGRLEQAIEAFRKATTIDRQNAKAFNNLGVAIAEAAKINTDIEIQEAIAAVDKAISLEPLYAKPKNDLGGIHLEQHNFKQGFDLFEWRWDANNWERFESSKPVWEGQPNKKVLVWREQGIGDEIMFSSVLSDLSEVAESVLLIADHRLLKLFSRSLPSNVKVLSQDTSIEPLEYDFHIPIGSLPKFFRKQPWDFKSASTGFLNADQMRSDLLRKSLSKSPKEKLVGLSWHTISKLPEAQKRNVDLITLGMHLGSVDATFISLQYRYNQLDKNSQNIAGIPIKHAKQIDTFNDLDGLAALINACDEVITIDNSTAHFAGALGVSTRLLLPANSDWRWGQFDKKSYWYDSVHIYRQKIPGSWDEPLRQVSQALGKN